MRKTRSEKFLTPVNAVMGGYDREDNISYGDHPAMVYDEFPVNDNKSPIVMFWHGGGWTTGNKDMYRFMGHMLQKLGAHTLIIGHPLYSEQTFPGFIKDAHLAIGHVQKKYPGRKIFGMGHSAGGHTAVISSLTMKEGLDGVISISTPCTLSERHWKHVFGSSFNDKLHDPRTYIRVAKNRPKFMLLHGALDYTVSIKDSISLNRKLEKSGFESQLQILKFVDHFTILPLLAFGPLYATRRRIKHFLFANH